MMPTTIDPSTPDETHWSPSFQAEDLIAVAPTFRAVKGQLGPADSNHIAAHAHADADANVSAVVSSSS